MPILLSQESITILKMEALRPGVLSLRMKSSPIRQLCHGCFTSLYRTGTVRRAIHTTAGNRQTCSKDTTLKPTNQVLLNGSRLSSRSLVLVKGRDACDLLQGLMTNDVHQLNEVKGQKVIYSMFLNKAGRVLYDVMCYDWANAGNEETQSYVLECDSTITQDLMKHLKMYKIRKKVDIASLDSDYQVWSIFSPGPTPSPGSESDLSHVYSDPRVNRLGQRVIVPQGDQVPGTTEVNEEDYTTHRYQWGVAEGVNELPPGECLPLESNLALMNGVSFTKGCYLGQELTARTHHTGVIRKRIMPINFTGNAIPTIPAGTSIKTSEGKNVGKLRCHLHENGLALLRTALVGNQLKITSEDGKEVELEANKPSWWPHDTSKIKDLHL